MLRNCSGRRMNARGLIGSCLFVGDWRMGGRVRLWLTAPSLMWRSGRLVCVSCDVVKECVVFLKKDTVTSLMWRSGRLGVVPVCVCVEVHFLWAEVEV